MLEKLMELAIPAYVAAAAAIVIALEKLLQYDINPQNRVKLRQTWARPTSVSTSV